jgi:2-methylcitrate dehydratase PrpD
VRVTGRVNPLAITLESRPHPDSGLESRLSFQHAMAVALIDGAAYPSQFTDARASDPIVARLRDKIDVTGDAGIAQDACEITVTLDDGRAYTERIAHATGTLDNPMTGAQLEEKFRALTAGVLEQGRVDELLATLMGLEDLDDVSRLVELCRTKQNEEKRR